MNKKILTIILFLGIYLLSTGISFATFNFLSKSKVQELIVSPQITPGESKFKVLLTGPKDRICPINGAKFTKQEEEIWSQKRPLLVMIENHADARPQSGISKADVVYEAVAEGAITRFMAVFYCGIAAYSLEDEYDVGPVRSARTYFLDWASEYGDYPLYAHVGGSNCSSAVPGGPCTTNKRAQALEQIQSYGWLNLETKSDLNQFALSYKVCRREPDRTGKPVATEHSMYCSSAALWGEAAKRGLTNLTLNLKKQNSWDKNFGSWLFKEDSPAGESISPEFDFWTGYKDYAVKWVYDNQSNSYKRYNGGVSQQDFYTKEELTAKNIVVQLMKETTSVDEHKHNLYQTIGSGKAVIFQDGKAIEGTWVKKDRQTRTRFYNNAGKEIMFNRGQIWIEILPTTSKVIY